MGATAEALNERPDYEGASPERRAMRRLLGILAHHAGQQLTGTVVCADPRHNLFLNYDELRELSKCTEWPAGLEFLSTVNGNVRSLISGPTNRAAITRDFSGLCWRGEHRVGTDGAVVYGIEWTLNVFNGAAWTGVRHLDREINSATGHAIELAELERRAPVAAKNLFQALGRRADSRLNALLEHKEHQEKIPTLPPGAGDVQAARLPDA